VVLPGIPTAFQAHVTGKVPDKDLAVLKIKADANTLAALRPI
jgi:S1-C subfamily serine protease